MSTDTETGRHVVDEPAPAEEAAAAPNPALLGLPVFIVGATALGLFLVGYKPAGSTGALLSIIVLSTGIGLIITTLWAIRVGAGPVASIFGTFSGFWLTLATLVYGLSHGWFGDNAELPASLAVFALCWLVIFVVLTLATLRLPAIFTVLFVLVDITVLLVFLYAAGGATSSGLATIAGYGAFLFTLVGIYLFVDAMGVALGGRSMPMGSPLVRNR
jgi:uncharacterized protein